MRNSTEACVKVLKIIMFFVVFAAAALLSGREPVSRFLSMPHAALFAASLAYLLSSFSAFIMRASHKAAAAVLSFLALYLLVFYFIGQFKLYVPFLTETNIVRIVSAAAFLLMAWDIYTAIRSARVGPRVRRHAREEAGTGRREPRVRKHARKEAGHMDTGHGRETEELRYAVSVLLESRWGRTPTDEEILDYAKKTYENRQQ